MAAIAVHPVTADREDLVVALAGVRAVTDREVNPTDPPAPPAELGAELFASWTQERKHAWLATIDGEPVGELVAVVDDVPANRHRVDAEWLAVVPDARRRGVADALVRALLAWADEDGRSSLTFWAPSLLDGAGAAYAKRLGAQMRMEERCSRLRVAELARDEVDRWLRAGRARTDGYRLVQWVGPAPDERLDLLVEAHRAMQDSPIDDLDWTIPEMTGDDLRSFEAACARRHMVPVTSAIVAADGAPAGFSVLFVNGHRPQLGWQGDTGVLGAHRGHALGRWLKAENLHQALAVEPRIEVVETYNAESNPWMLAINVAMGFRPHATVQAWQVDADEVRAQLG